MHKLFPSMDEPKQKQLRNPINKKQKHSVETRNLRIPNENTFFYLTELKSDQTFKLVRVTENLEDFSEIILWLYLNSEAYIDSIGPFGPFGPFGPCQMIIF